MLAAVRGGAMPISAVLVIDGVASSCSEDVNVCVSSVADAEI